MVYIPGGGGGSSTPRGATGTIEIFGGAAADIPTDSLLCDGSFVAQATYPDLFAAIGHGWNGGVDPADGTFKLPSLAEKFLRGAKADESDLATIVGADTHNHGGATGVAAVTVPAGAVPPPAAIGAHSHSISSSNNIPSAGAGTPIIWT